MIVHVPFPSNLVSPAEKKNFIKEIGEWGDDNLKDQTRWGLIKTLVDQYRITYGTKSISFNVEHEEDAMAIKLTWCE